MTISDTRPATWASRAGDMPADLADVFRQAAKLIEAEGYDPCPDVDGPGHNVSSAIEAAAALACPGNPADAADLAEDAHARLAGFLHLTGLRTRRTSIHDLCDEVARWEDCRPGTGYRTQAETIAVLETAAALLDHLADATGIIDLRRQLARAQVQLDTIKRVAAS